MIVVLKIDTPDDKIEGIAKKIEDLGFEPHVIKGVERTVIGVIGDKDKRPIKTFINFEDVYKVVEVSKPYKLAARSSKEEDTIIEVCGSTFGGDAFTVIAGPCSVENRDQIISTAHSIRKSGATLLRGGAYKPRTSPYSFQGLEEDGLKLLLEAKEETGLGIVTELLSASTVGLVSKYADIVQIGARNMQNFSLLKQLGTFKKPVMLKRGLSATLEEFLMSAEYIMSVGNYEVILCERGIRTFEKAYRNVLDLNAVPALKKMSHLPVIVDPSHGTGRIDLIPAMSKAAIAAGADGLVLEVHPDPANAYSDGPQSLTFDQFEQLMTDIKPFVDAAGKRLVVL